MAYNKGDFYHANKKQVIDNAVIKDSQFGTPVDLASKSTIGGVELMTSSSIPTTERNPAGTLCVVTAPSATGLYVQEGTTDEPSWKKVITGDEPGPTPQVGYITFVSNDSFSVQIYLGEESGPIWDGIVEYSTDKTTWTTWDGAEVSSNANNEIYFRGSQNTVFSGENGNGFEFPTGSDITVSGNLETLLDYETVVAGNHPPMAEHCFSYCFGYCPVLNIGTLGATTLAPYCYSGICEKCQSLIQLPLLPALNMTEGCYGNMFIDCSQLKFSETQTEEYSSEFRIPAEGVGSAVGATDWNAGMFTGTGGTFTGDPQLNHTYYYYIEQEAGE